MLDSGCESARKGQAKQREGNTASEEMREREALGWGSEVEAIAQVAVKVDSGAAIRVDAARLREGGGHRMR